jgi:hypothetical protein
MFDINNVCLILQGYSFSKEQLLQDVINYHNYIKNIVISSYSNFIDDELYNYSKIIKNDYIGDNVGNCNKDKLNSIVNYTYFEHEIIEGLNVDKFDWNNSDNYWAQKAIFKMCTTTKRGINVAQNEFPNCTHYFILRADMTLHNLNYLIQKWCTINNNINDNIFQEKIILKYYYEYEQIFNITNYLAFGNKNDIEKFYSIKNAYIPNNPESGFPERIMSRSFINSINDKLTNEEIYTNYFYHEKEFNITWYKYLDIYNVNGLWGIKENDCIKNSNV